MPSKKTPNQNSQEGSVILTSFHRLPLLIIIFGLSLLPIPINHIPAISISLFGIFLLIQSFTLQLELTKEDFIVKQLGRELRRFPFENWLAWRIFLPGLPGILYFREKASPHLLPILFDPKMLENQLRLRVGGLEIKQETQNS